MNILITGDAGFVGRHVISALPEDANLIGWDAFEPRVHGEQEEEGADHCNDFPWEAPEASEIDVVIHLAAQVGVADSMTDPLRYVVDNTWDTAAFLKRLYDSEARPQKLVVASSMSIYGDPGTSAPIPETHPIAPESVYGLTKFDQERLTLIYGKMMRVPVVALRFWNLYGPGQALSNPYTGALANFAARILNGEPPIIYEDGLQTRDFVYVEDAAEVVAEMALNTVEGVFNVATGVSTSLLGVANLMCEEFGRPDLKPTPTGEIRPGDIRHAIGDASRLCAALPEWRPRSLAEGMKTYVEWLREEYAS